MVAPLVGELLAAAPSRLKVLPTSREVLSVYGEQVGLGGAPISEICAVCVWLPRQAVGGGYWPISQAS